jgi:hypothetical protein
MPNKPEWSFGRRVGSHSLGLQRDPRAFALIFLAGGHVGDCHDRCGRRQFHRLADTNLSAADVRSAYVDREGSDLLDSHGAPAPLWGVIIKRPRRDQDIAGGRPQGGVNSHVQSKPSLPRAVRHASSSLGERSAGDPYPPPPPPPLKRRPPPHSKRSRGDARNVAGRSLEIVSGYMAAIVAASRRTPRPLSWYCARLADARIIAGLEAACRAASVLGAPSPPAGSIPGDALVPIIVGWPPREQSRGVSSFLGPPFGLA